MPSFDQQALLKKAQASITESFERCTQMAEANARMQEQIAASRRILEDARRVLATMHKQLGK